MNGYLKQSTASQTRWIGPFVDDTDFKTAETALTIANTDIKVSKNGGASASKNSGGGTHDVNGMYAVTWDATDTATVGQLAYSVKVAGALQVFGFYTVLEEAVYDAWYAASAVGYTADQPVNVTKVNGTSQTARDLGAQLDAAVTTRLAPTTAGRTLDVSATGEAGIDWANIGAPTTVVALSGTTVKTATDVETDTADIQSRLPAALVSGRIDASVGAVAAGAITAAAIADGAIDAATFAAGAINAAAIATDAITAGKIAADAIGASELAADAVAEIADAVWDELQSGHTTAGTFGKYLDAPVSGATAPTAAAVADAVWDETLADHLTAGSTGAGLNAAGAAGDPWSTAIPGAYGAGTAGKIVGDNLNATVSSRSSHSAADVWASATRSLTDKAGFALSSAGIQAIWDALTSALTTVGSIGKLLVDNINATISSRSTLTAAQVNTEADTALADVGLTSTVTGRIDAAVSSRLASGTVAVDVTAIKAKTDNLPAAPAATGDIPSAATVASQVRTELTTELGRMDVAVSTRATPAQVNMEVVDALTVDASAEPTAVPAANAPVSEKLAWLYALGRNRVLQTSSAQTLRNDADSANIASANVSDDGTTFERGEWT